MKKKLVITDAPYKSGTQDDNTQVIYWNRLIKKKKEIDLLEFIESKPSKFKNDYINFINKIQKNIITLSFEKISIDKYLSREGFNSINYNSVIEKCNWGKSFYINEIIKCYAIDFLIKEIKPDLVEVSLKKNNETLLILKKIFKKYKTSCKINLDNRQNLINKNNFFFPLFIKTTLNYSIFLIKNYSFLKSRSIQWLKFNADYLFVSYINNEDLKNIKKNIVQDSYWGNISSIFKKTKKIRWVYFATTQRKLIDIINLSKIIFRKNKKKMNEKHINIYDFLTLKIFFTAFIIWIKILFRLNKIKNLDNIFYDKKNKIDNSSFLANDFKKSYYSIEMLNNIVIYLIFQEISKKIKKQKKCFYLHEGAPWEYSLIKNFKNQKHGHLYGIGHSTISYWDLRFFKTVTNKTNLQLDYNQPDFFIVNGEDMRKKISYYTNKKKIIIGESLRYRYLLNLKKKKKIKKNSNFFNFLVILDIVKDISLKQIKLVEKLIHDYKNINIIIKVHPTNNIMHLLKKNLINKCTLLPLENLLKDVDMVLTSNITSANVETSFLNIPTYCYNQPTSLNLCPILDKNIINFFSYYSQLKKIIEQKKYLKKNKMKNNFLLLNNSNAKWKKILK